MRVAQIVSAVLDDAVVGVDVSHRLVAACAHALPVTGVSPTLMTDTGDAGTVAVSEPSAAAMEDLQFTVGEGPCVQCSTTGRPVLQPDLAATGPARWPAFTDAAWESGIGAVFALPLLVGVIKLGVLGLYRDEPGQLSGGQLTEALCFAAAATEVLLHVQAQQHQQSTYQSGPGMIPLVEDRAEVHQATGMIAVQAGLSMADALVRLRARAYSTERRVADVSEDVLAGVVKYTDKDDDRGEGCNTAS